MRAKDTLRPNFMPREHLPCLGVHFAATATDPQALAEATLYLIICSLPNT